VYAYVTLLCLGALYSVVSIPYGALMPLMTKDSKEKVQLSSMRSIGSSIGAVLITSLVMPLVHLFGGVNENRGFFLTALVFSIAGTFCFLIVFYNCKERHIEPSHDGEPSALGSIKDVASNRMFVVCFCFAVVHLVRIGGILTCTVYFALIILHAPWTIPFLFGAMSVGSVGAASMATPYYSRFGFRKGNAFALLFALAMYGALPFLEGRPWAFLAVFTLSCFGAQACTTAIFAMVANATDYHELKFSSRADGLIYSCLSLSTKIGIALGAALIAFGLSSAHYVANAVSHEAFEMIRALFYIVPCVLMVVQIVVMQFYKLDTKHTLIAKEIATRRT
jgi:GPH family glycoside/pentoside/hexuronide:cation symporter